MIKIAKLPVPQSDVEDPNPRLNRCPIEELFPRPLGTKQLHERVVERQQPIVAGGRDIFFYGISRVHKLFVRRLYRTFPFGEDKSAVFPINNDLIVEQIRIIFPQRSTAYLPEGMSRRTTA